MNRFIISAALTSAVVGAITMLVLTSCVRARPWTVPAEATAVPTEVWESARVPNPMENVDTYVVDYKDRGLTCLFANHRSTYDIVVSCVPYHFAKSKGE